MRTLFAFILLSLSITAFAQRVETVIDGRLYSCTPTSVNPGGAIDCIDAAYRGPFSREESIQICQGARNDAPARCAIAAYAGPFTRTESVQICRGAYSNGPVECYARAYAGPFSKDESLRLCSSPSATTANADCALKAYAGVYTREESINLCRTNYKSKISIKALDRAELEDDMIRAVEKAVQEGTYKK